MESSWNQLKGNLFLSKALSIHDGCIYFDVRKSNPSFIYIQYIINIWALGNCHAYVIGQCNFIRSKVYNDGRMKIAKVMINQPTYESCAIIMCQ